MKIRLSYILLLVGFSLALSCSRSLLDLEPETRVKVFALEQESGTKVVETAGRNFSWTAGDPVQYYRLLDGGTVSSSGLASTSVTTAGKSAKLEVNYNYPSDKEVVALYLGAAIDENEVGSLAKNSFTVAGGIPAVQDGNLISYLVCSGKGNIQTSQSLTLHHLQTFISFSLVSDGTSKGKFNRIVISDKENAVDVAGDATYTFNDTTGVLKSCSIAPVGASKTITINLPSSGIETGKVYYAAINPASFTGGLRVTLYKDDNKLAYATTSVGEVLVKGCINELGTLDFHNVIPADAAPVVSPEYSSICNTGGWKMTKKLWATFSPSDVSGITWEIVKAGVNDATYTDEPAEIESNYGTITPGAKETYDGKEQFTAIVTPKCAKGWLLVKATLDGDEALSDYAFVKIDDFIDIGASVLWARSNLQGSFDETAGTVASLCAKTSDRGDYYRWGYLDAVDIMFVPDSYDDKGYNRWGGAWSGSNSDALGGRYNSTDKKTVLLPEDDVCTKSNSFWHIPTWDEICELTPTSRTNYARKVCDNVVYDCYSSLSDYYTDVELRFPINGCHFSSGGLYHVFSDMYVQSSTLYSTLTGGSSVGTIAGWKAGDSNSYKLRENLNSYVLCQATVETSLYRFNGWGIRPVRSKEGWYPTIGTPPYSE